MALTILILLYLAFMAFAFVRIHYCDARDSIMAEVLGREIKAVEIRFPDGYTVTTSKAAALDLIVAIEMGEWLTRGRAR